MLLSKRDFIQYSALLGTSMLLPSCSSSNRYNVVSERRIKLSTPLSQRSPQRVSPRIVSSVANTSLSNQINATVQRMRRDGKIRADESTAWQVTDITTGKVFAAINENMRMQCASMVKPMVIQAYLYCHYLKDPKLYPLNEKVMKELRGMIVKSNNTFTNHIFKRLGGPEGVQWMLKKQAPNVFRYIHIVENIPKGGKTYLNKAAASDYTRFLHAIWYEELPGSKILKNLMGIKNHDRISTRTQQVPKNITVYDKTGSTSQLCGDFGIIAYRNKKGISRPYTFTGIIEKKSSASNYTRWITEKSNIIREISDMTYLYIKRQNA